MEKVIMDQIYWFVYVIHSVEGLNYVGMTRDLKARLDLHNAGKSQWTKRGAEWKVVYCEKYESSKSARQREKYFKNTAGREWLQRRGYL